ncbi:diaminopimelate epimerase [Chloroflexota bacterium]
MFFTKMQACGNDFVVVESDKIEKNWPELAQTVCSRHFGIGADSLLLVLPSEKGDFLMRTFDSDGSEAEACGNGIRCLAKYYYEKGYLAKGTGTVIIETVVGVRNINLVHENGKLDYVRASMGKPGLTLPEIPFTPEAGVNLVYIKNMPVYTVSVAGRTLQLHLVSMGNPHAVYYTDEPVDEFPLDIIGPMVENLLIFPKRANFEVVRRLEGNKIEARVWERGVGETLACGTGACATTVSAVLRGYVTDSAEIKLRGGALQVKWDGAGEVELSGPAQIVYEGNWPE